MDTPDFISDEQMASMDAQAPKPAAAPSSATSIDLANPPDFIPDDQMPPSDEEKQAKYGTKQEQAKAALEGLAQGVAGPLAPLAETKLFGVKPEDIRGREEANPVTHGISEAGGFIGGMFTPFSMPWAIGKVGEGVTKAAELAGHIPELAGIGQKMAVGAAKAAAEMTAFQASNEATKAILEKPEQTPGSAVTNIGLSAVLGGVFGGATSGLGAIAKAGLNKMGLSELRDRFAARAGGLNPAEAMEKEFTDAVQTYHGMNDELLGPSGMKAQALQKVMPQEVTPALKAQLEDIGSKADAAFKEMQKQEVPQRLSTKFQNEYQKLQEVITNPSASTNQIFDAMNDFKGSLQGYSKGNYGPFAVPKHAEAYDFINITKNLGHDVRTALEDSGAWGGAADLQKKLNSSWTKILPTIKDVQSKFMTKIEGEYVPDPAKFNTYLKDQAGKSTNQTTRQKIMGNFVSAFEKHAEAVNQAYADAGIANPHTIPGLGALKESLGKQSLGVRIADHLYDKMGADALASGVGAAAGAAVHPSLAWPAALLSKELLGPSFGAILPSMLEKGINSSAADSVMSFTKNVNNGNKLVTKAAKGLFMSGAKLIPDNLQPDPDKIKKLDEQIKGLGDNVEGIAQLTGDIGHYLPLHGMEMSKAIGNAIQYINSKRPTDAKTMPLNSPQVISPDKQAAFDRTLRIVQQPLQVLQHIQDGTLTSSDIKDLATVYPEFHQKLSTEIYQNIVNRQQDEEPIPYRTRMQLGMFLGQPLDSTMTSVGINGAQPQPQQEPAPPVKGNKKPSGKAGTEMEKGAKSHMTQSQAAESDRAGRH